MNMQSRYLSTQPANYLQLIKRSFRLYRAGFKQAIIFSFMLSLVLFSPRLVSFLIGQDIYLDISLFNPERLWLLLADLVSLVLFIAIFWHYFCVARGKHESLAEDFSKGFKKVLRVFVAGIVQAVIVLGMIMLVFALQYLLFNYKLLFANNLASLIFSVCFFAGTSFITFYVSALFIFQVPLIVIENRGIFSALERSALLVWNHWLRTVSVQITPWFCYIIFLILVEHIVGLKFHFYFVRQESVSITASVIQIIVFTLLIPWVATLLLVQMKDLEIRNHQI
jgi:hypothetical protein